MNRHLIARLAALAGLSLVAGAQAQQTITLFGLQYRVDRVDYFQNVSWPSPVFAGDTIRLFESEGVTWAGNNKLLLTADDMADIFIGNPDNWLVEVDVVSTNGRVTGLNYSRTVATIDTGAYDPNPGGITINQGASGLGAGGDAVIAGNAGALFGFGYRPGNFGQSIEFPTGSGCVAAAGQCNLPLAPFNTNAEDAAFVNGWGGRPDYFFVINQDLVALDESGVERWTTAGVRDSEFPVARGKPADASGPAIPAIPGGVAKGLAFARDTSKFPPALRRPNGVILVSFDRAYPALQAYDVDGTLLGTEFLSTSGTPLPPWRIDMSGCPASGQVSRPHIESIAIDPGRGRIFLVNQGAFASCNLIWVLTPCVADFDMNGVRDVSDIFAFLSSWFAGCAGQPGSGCNGSNADVDDNGVRDVSDIFAFLSAWFAGC